jgi:DNA-binding response OmpR family regulator
VVASGNAVLLIDTALADQNAKAMVTQVHKQFPDLAIIVAGRREDEHELAPLVSEGAIFRFLHKPASAERIRNFVDATQRRPKGTDVTATLPGRTKSQLFGGSSTASNTASNTAEIPKLAPPFKLKLGDGQTRRWTRHSLLPDPGRAAGLGSRAFRAVEAHPDRSGEAGPGSVGNRPVGRH